MVGAIDKSKAKKKINQKIKKEKIDLFERLDNNSLEK